MTYLILLALFLGNSGGTRQPHETCDLIELNAYYDDCGKLAYRQYIFYDYSPDYRRYDVVFWCLESDAGPVIKRGGKYNVVFIDRMAKSTRKTMQAKLYRETHTVTDPERENKRFLSEVMRRVLVRCER